MGKPARVLLLGGTAESRQLAGRLSQDSRFQIETSLAGATANPAPVDGAMRRGGFGGVEGLVDYLRARGIDLLIDCTHPFASTMSAHARAAAQQTGTAHLVVQRPPWRKLAGDNWVDVADIEAAAGRVESIGQRIFLTIGRQEVDAFADCRDVWFLIRLIDKPPSAPALTSFEMISARGPFDLAAERALLHEWKIDCLVSKNSGGTDTYAKIEAARELGLPVVMVARPSAPTGPATDSVEAALMWMEDWLG